MNLDGLTIDDLDLRNLDLRVPPSRGRKAHPLSHSYIRDLEESDIRTLIIAAPRDVDTPAIQKLKHSHHQVARLLAEGRPGTEVSLITGYSQSRISILKHDPAFQELMNYYVGLTEEVYLNVHERLASLGMDALQELQERLEEDPDKFSNKELLDTVAATMDRAGFGPKSTQVHEHNFSFDSLLDAVKDEVRNRQNGTVTTLDARPNPARSQEGGEVGLGLAVIESSDDDPPQSAEGHQGSGEAL